MIKMTIKLDLEYGCEPIWLLDEDGQWTNNSKEFTFVGFKTPEDKIKFKSDLIRFAAEIKAKLKGKYKIIDAFHYEYY